MFSVRTNVFETNSSSSHSISIHNSHLEQNLMEIDCDGTVWVTLEEFCHHSHSSQNDRLAFLIQNIICDEFEGNALWCCNQNEWIEITEKLYATNSYRELESIIVSYVNESTPDCMKHSSRCEQVRIRDFSEGYIDHESAYEGWKDFCEEWGTDPIDFVFGNCVSLHFEFNG